MILTDNQIRLQGNKILFSTNIFNRALCIDLTLKYRYHLFIDLIRSLRFTGYVYFMQLLFYLVCDDASEPF